MPTFRTASQTRKYSGQPAAHELLAICRLTFAKHSPTMKSEAVFLGTMLPDRHLLLSQRHVLFIDNQCLLNDNSSAGGNRSNHDDKEPVDRELVHADSTVGATVSGQQRGFAMQVRMGGGQKVLVTSRGTVRLFASLDTAGAFVRDLGIPHFEVDMSGRTLPDAFARRVRTALRRCAVPELSSSNNHSSS